MKILNVSFSNWFQNQAFYCSLIICSPFIPFHLSKIAKYFIPNLPLRDFYATVCSAMTTIFHWFWSLNFYCRPELWWWKLQKKVQAMRPSWALYAMNANFFLSHYLAAVANFPVLCCLFFPSRSPLFLCDFNWHRENCDVNMKLSSEFKMNTTRWDGRSSKAWEKFNGFIQELDN